MFRDTPPPWWEEGEGGYVLHRGLGRCKDRGPTHDPYVSLVLSKSRVETSREEILTVLPRVRIYRTIPNSHSLTTGERVNPFKSLQTVGRIPVCRSFLPSRSTGDFVGVDEKLRSTQV